MDCEVEKLDYEILKMSMFEIYAKTKKLISKIENVNMITSIFNNSYQSKLQNSYG
jgi:hypothetical protein